MRIFDMIIPVKTKDFDMSEAIKDLKVFFDISGFQFNVLFVAGKDYKKPKSYKNAEGFNLITTELESSNELITKGFELSNGCVLLADLEEENWQEILNKIIINIEHNDVVICKIKARKNNFFRNILKRIYNYYVNIFNLNIDYLTVDGFGYFNEDVADVIKSLPEKNAYLRNFAGFVAYKTKIAELRLETSSKFFKNFSLKSKNSIISLSLFALSILLFTSLIVFNTTFSLWQNSLVYFLIGLMLSGVGVFFAGYFITKDLIEQRANLNSK
jgi:hypothetical protein